MITKEMLAAIAEKNDDTDLIPRYERFAAMTANPNIRTCEACGHSQVGNPRQAAMTCEMCSLQFCFEHAQAHPGR